MHTAVIPRPHSSDGGGGGGRRKEEENVNVIVKVLYPEIRQFMAADLANLKQAVTLVSKLLSMAMKDTIEAVRSVHGVG